MIEATARAITRLAAESLPPEREAWGHAMMSEFEETVDDGRPVAFALGCLAGAWRSLPMHHAGRFLLARSELALGALVPLATFHLGCALSGLRLATSGRDFYYDRLSAGNAAQGIVAETYLEAAPIQTLLLLALGVSHLLVAWNLMDWHPGRLVRTIGAAAFIAALLVASILTIMPDATGVPSQVAALALELSILPLLVAWNRRQFHVSIHQRKVNE